MDDELGLFLDGLRGEGSADSSGHFTLDVRRALEKLRQYRFPEPHLFVLSLVASAVAGGATHVDLESRRTGLALSYDGPALSLEELRDLFGSLFSDGRQHLRELAIGLHASESLYAERSVVSWDPERQRGAHLRLRPEQLEVTPLREPPFEPGTVTRVVLRHRSFFVLRPPELQAVSDWCRHSGVRVRVNGHVVGVPREPLLLSLEPATFGPGLGEPVSGALRHPHEGRYYALLHVPREPEPGSLRLVVNGLSFRAEGFEEFGHLEVRAPWLAKDLSQVRLVESPAVAALCQEVADELWRALANLALRLEGLDESWHERIRGWLLDLLARHPEPAQTPLWQADWLRCAYGGHTSLRMLQAQMQRPHGPRWLAVAREPFHHNDPPYHVLLETPAMRSPLRRLFRKVVYEW